MKTFSPKAITENKKAKPEHQRPLPQDGFSAEAVASRVSAFVDNRPETITQRKLQAVAQISPQVQHLAQRQAMDNNSPRQLAQRQQVQRGFDRPVQRQARTDGEELQMHSGPGTRQRQVVQRELDEKWNPKNLQLELDEDLHSVLELYFELDPKDKNSKYGFSLLHAAKQRAKNELLNAINVEIETLKEQINEEATQEIPDARNGKLLGKGAIQQTYLVTVGGKEKVWKPEPSEVEEAFSAFEVGGIPGKGARISLRGEASSKIAESLGATVLAATELSVGIDENGNLVTGQLMDFVEGEALGATGTVNPEKRAAVKARPDYVRDLFTLQLIDYITGQVDRHAADVFIGKAGVKAVDHDFSLGKEVAGRLRKSFETEVEFYKGLELMSKGIPDYAHVKYLPQYIDNAIAETLRAYKEDSLDELLGKHLTKAELAALKARIVHAKEMLDDHMKIVSNWEEHFEEIPQPDAPKEEKKKKKGLFPKGTFTKSKRSPKKQEKKSAPPPPPAKKFSGPVPYIQGKSHLAGQREGQSHSAESCVQRVKVKSELSLNLSGEETSKYVSHSDAQPMKAGENGVITATSGDSPTGAHTRIFLEKVEEPDRPSTIHTDLQNPDGIRVTIEEIQDNKKMLDKLENLPRRRTWRVDEGRIEDARTEADKIKGEAEDDKYKYAYFGRAPGKKKQAINCARYGEKILKAAGISASAGRVFKIPKVLTREPKKK